LESYIKGTARKYRGGSFYHVERSLKEIDSGKIGEYIAKHKDYLLVKNLKRQFPDLEYIPKSRMLFFDIETCGFGSESPIISIALAHMHHGADIGLECLFARNYSEEKAILQYFLNLLPQYEAFFSYNGKSFDGPRTKSRAIHNGLYNKELKDLSGLVLDGDNGNNGDDGHDDPNLSETANGNGESRHHDLYHLCRQKNRLVLPDAKLKTIEKLVFGFTRSNDIASEDIPRVYYEYVYGRKMELKKVRVDKGLWKKCRQEIETMRQQEIQTMQNKGSSEQQIQEAMKSREAVYQSYTERIYDNRQGAIKEVPEPGEKIDEEQRKRDMARLIHHNLLDTITLSALLCYICGPHSEQPQSHGVEGELPF
jgi:uncharacterized protein YprB with RNaseH-like and TPR domain